MNWKLILPLIAIGVILVTAIPLWLSRSSLETYKSVIEKLEDQVKAKQTELKLLRESLEHYTEKDVLYQKEIEALKREADEYKAGRKYWFKQHQRIADSVQALTIDEQQRYWAERYPVRQQSISTSDN